MKERQRKRLLYSKGQGLLGHLQQILDGSHVWVVLVTTGITVGLIAACIDIATNWLGDLKLGYCKGDQGANQFYLNRQFCCWGHEGKLASVNFLLPILKVSRIFRVCGLGAMEGCPRNFFWWRRIRDGVHLFRDVFCRCALPVIPFYSHSQFFQVFFASCACILVRSYAPYAKHSGIPEIKTVLGGFVMKHLMGGWTLAIKSIGLVSLARSHRK